MNLSMLVKPDREIISTLFLPPFNSWTAPELYAYFQSRDTVRYFPVVDEGESSKEKMDRILDNHFEFNGETHFLSWPQDWLRNPSSDREWLFMLHKFYYGVGLGKAYHETHDRQYAAQWIGLTDSWIGAVPLEFLPSRVAGRRIQNWIYAHYYFVTASSTSVLDLDFYVRFLDSLHRQVTYLWAHLDEARNHRTLELSAIFLAAVVFPEFAQASEWLDFAKKALQANLNSDLLPDGVHCELSTMYHHLVLKNYLVTMRLAKLNDISMPESMYSQLRQALEFSMHVHKPDGMVPAFSDSDIGSYLPLLDQGYELYGDESFRFVATKGAVGQPPADRSKGFPSSGYYILRSGWGGRTEAYEDERYLLMDCGPLGEGNHGHLDALHIELAAFGRSLIVDPGRYTYDETGEINWRAWFRGTAAHNTVLVDGQHQTRYGPFHNNSKSVIQGPSPKVEVKTFFSQNGFDYLHAVAKSAEYPVVHERKILFACLEYWIIVDLLIADEPHRYDLLFHLSTQAQGAFTSKVREKAWILESPHLLLAQPLDPDTKVAVVEGQVAPSYGVKHHAPILQFSRKAAMTCFHTVVFPFKKDPPILTIQELQVSEEGLPCPSHSASALSIKINHHGQEYRDMCFMKHWGAVSTYQCGYRTFQDSVAFIRTDAQGQVIKRLAVSSQS